MFNQNAPLDTTPTERDRRWLGLFIFRSWFGALFGLLTGLALLSTKPLVGVLSIALAGLTGTAGYMLHCKRSRGVMLAKVYLAINGGLLLATAIDAFLEPIPTSSWVKPLMYLVGNVGFYLYLTYSRAVNALYLDERVDQYLDGGKPVVVKTVA